MAEQVQIEYELHAASVHAEMQRLDNELGKVQKSTLDFDTKLQKALRNRKAYAEAQFNLKRLQTEFARTGKAAKGAGGLRGIGFFGQQVGYLVSDARYGVLGMSNNLSILIPQFQSLQKQAKKTGVSLGKAFAKSLWGPTGVLIAMQLLIVLLPEIIEWWKKWRNGITELDQAMKKSELNVIKNTVRQQALQNMLQNQNLTLAERHRILNKLDKLGVSVKGPDGRWLENLEDINEAIERNIKLVKLRAKARVIEEQLVKTIQEQLQHEEGEGASWWEQFFFDFLPHQDSAQEAIDKYYDEQASEADGAIRDLFLKLQKLLAEISDEEGEEGPSLFERILLGLQTDTKRLKEKLQQELETNLQTILRQQDAEEQILVDHLNNKLITEEEYEKLRYEMEKKYGILRQLAYEKDAEVLRIKEEAKRDQIQATLEKVTSFFVNAARLNQENKGLAKAAVITDAAVASIGIWRDYHGAKNTIPAPFNTIAALATIGTLGVATASAIKSIDSQSKQQAGGGSSQRPNFNIIGSTGTNQLAEAVTAQQENQKPIKAQVVLTEVESAQELERQAETQASLG